MQRGGGTDFVYIVLGIDEETSIMISFCIVCGPRCSSQNIGVVDQRFRYWYMNLSEEAIVKQNGDEDAARYKGEKPTEQTT